MVTECLLGHSDLMIIRWQFVNVYWVTVTECLLGHSDLMIIGPVSQSLLGQWLNDYWVTVSQCLLGHSE